MCTPLPRTSALVLLALLTLAGCAAETKAAATKEAAAHTEPIEGTPFKRVVLVPRAAERLGLKTVEIRPATPEEMRGVVPAGQGGRTAIPYDAVLYDKTGATFSYINPKDLDFVRQPITVENIRDKVALLTAGPPSGTKVVTVGAAELYGVETGVGK